MSSAGHIMDMIILERNNMAEMKARREQRQFRIRQMYAESLRTEKKKLFDKDVPPEVLSKIKSEIRERLKKERVKRVLLVTVIAILVTVVITTLAGWLLS